MPPLRTYQIPVLTSRAVDDVTISAPQLGKTITGQVWLLAEAWVHGRDRRPWWWMAPTYAQAKHGFGGFCDLARSAGVLVTATTAPPLKARLVNGAIIEGRSWERPEGMYGPSVLGGVVDEFGQLTAAGYSAISSRRAETINEGFGRYRYLGNVGEIGGPAEDLWRMAEAGADGFAGRRWTWRDRAAAMPCECDLPVDIEFAKRHAEGCQRAMYVLFIARERSRMSDPQFRMLYDAEWADWNELPVYQFNRTAHIRDDLQYDPSTPLDVSCDFNVDPMAWVIGQHDAVSAWAFDEIRIEGGATTAMACKEVIRRYPNNKTTVNIYGDASGSGRHPSSSETNYDTIRNMLGKHYNELLLHVPKANPNVTDRVNAYNGLLAPADLGGPYYWISPACPSLADDLARVSWLPGTRQIDKRDKKRTHFTDADGYRIAYLFPCMTGDSFTSVSVRSSHSHDPIMDMVN